MCVSWANTYAFRFEAILSDCSPLFPQPSYAFLRLILPHSPAAPHIPAGTWHSHSTLSFTHYCVMQKFVVASLQLSHVSSARNHHTRVASHSRDNFCALLWPRHAHVAPLGIRASALASVARPSAMHTRVRRPPVTNRPRGCVSLRALAARTPPNRVSIATNARCSAASIPSTRPRAIVGCDVPIPVGRRTAS